MCFFFFKQKTAYDVRISDWSSDVCSSDLALAHAGPVGEIAPFSQFIETLVPTNVVTAAANDAFLPLIVFALVFGFALTRLPAEQRKRMNGFFQIIADAMVVVINGVLWLGPVGVFALDIGRKHVRTPVTHAHLVCRLSLEN